MIAIGPNAYQFVRDEFVALNGVSGVVGQLEVHEARWRLTYLLGTLDPAPGVVEALEEIVALSLPDPAVDEFAYRAEVRVRLRAIDSLRKLGQATRF